MYEWPLQDALRIVGTPKNFAENISKFVIPVASKDIVATISILSEGGRSQITAGGYKVTVVLADEPYTF